MTDIRVGDLIKATRKHDLEEHRQGRVVRLLDLGVVFTSGLAIDLNHYDVEILDRTLPPIDEELILAVRSIFAITYPGRDAHWRAVINTVREYDRKNATKENSK